MEWIVNAREMKTCDNATTEHFKMSADDIPKNIEYIE